MFIQTEETPNPLTLKYIPGKDIAPEKPINFADKEQATGCHLAESLFMIEGVVNVFFGSDFISITKEKDIAWDILRPQILGAIMEYFMENETVSHSQCTPVEGNVAHKEESKDPVIQEIKELIDTHVRPAVAQDGGDIVFHEMIDGVVYLKMQGACSGCPSSTITLKNGIENMLRHYIPEVKEVRAVV